MIETNLTATRQKDHFKELLELSQQSIRNALSPKGSSAKVPIFYHTNHNGHKKGTAISRRLLNYSYGSKTTASLFGCSECTKFLDKYADLVWIDENKNLRWVLWDFELPEDNDFKDFFDQEFMTPGFGNGQRKPILKVSRPLVLNHFSLNNGAYQLGTASNVSNEGVEWEHFHMRINKRDGYPLTYINTSSRDYDLGVVALRRDVVAGILDLINLHRAKHVFENNSGLRLKQYNLNKINYLISLANQLNDLETSYPVVIAELMRKHTTYYSVKNTVLGVFLISLNTKGVDWALREYKEYTDSEVYMRPTREVVDTEIERGEKLVTELGYVEAILTNDFFVQRLQDQMLSPNDNREYILGVLFSQYSDMEERMREHLGDEVLVNNAVAWYNDKKAAHVADIEKLLQNLMVLCMTLDTDDINNIVKINLVDKLNAILAILENRNRSLYLTNRHKIKLYVLVSIFMSDKYPWKKDLSPLEKFNADYALKKCMDSLVEIGIRFAVYDESVQVKIYKLDVLVDLAEQNVYVGHFLVDALNLVVKDLMTYGIEPKEDKDELLLSLINRLKQNPYLLRDNSQEIKTLFNLIQDGEAVLHARIKHAKQDKEPKYIIGTALVHNKTGKNYVVVAEPDPNKRLEPCDEPYYEYAEVDSNVTWVRCQTEMEDGRFRLAGAPNSA